jgi:hypothetical protein
MIVSGSSDSFLLSFVNKPAKSSEFNRHHPLEIDLQVDLLGISNQKRNLASQCSILNVSGQLTLDKAEKMSRTKNLDNIVKYAVLTSCLLKS